MRRFFDVVVFVAEAASLVSVAAARRGTTDSEICDRVPRAGPPAVEVPSAFDAWGAPPCDELPGPDATSPGKSSLTASSSDELDASADAVAVGTPAPGSGGRDSGRFNAPTCGKTIEDKSKRAPAHDEHDREHENRERA
jgi:hypothetical protein